MSEQSGSYPQGWTRCSGCRGYGIREEWTGNEVSVQDCYECQGSGMERARDAKGRFARVEAR